MLVPTQALPRVYACLGGSSAARLAHRRSAARAAAARPKMPCIAGLGDDVARLLKTARSGRSIIALDGCPLVCVKSSLARHGIAPDRHYQLQQYGVKKRQHEDFDLGQATAVLERVNADLLTEIPSAKPSLDMTHPSLHQAFNSSAPSP